MEHVLKSPFFMKSLVSAWLRHLCASYLSAGEQKGPNVLWPSLVITDPSCKTTKKLDSSYQGSLWETLSRMKSFFLFCRGEWAGTPGYPQEPGDCECNDSPISTIKSLPI